MNDDIHKLQDEMLAMMKRVGPRTRYRLLEIHERLSHLVERLPASSAEGEPERPEMRARAAA